MQIECEQDKVLNEPIDFSLNMFNLPPEDPYTLSKLLEVSKKRIDTYKRFDKFLETHRLEEDEQQKKFYEKLLHSYEKSDVFSYKKQDDLVSHWILKLVFEDVDKGQFVMHEGYIFTCRLLMQAYEWAKVQLDGNNNNKQEENPVRLQYLRKYQRHFYFDLLCEYMGINSQDPKIFKGKQRVHEEEIPLMYRDAQKNIDILDKRRVEVPFKFCNRLISKYQIELNKGKGVISPEDAFIILQDLFQETLFQHHNNLKKVSDKIYDYDERITTAIQLLKEYNKSSVHYFKSEHKTDSFNIDLSNINSLIDKHFPLCMSEIMKGFRQKHMLKHWGRLQLGMFLKGIGLKLQDSLKLFENELKKTREGEKKINEYKYYIEHMYGKRGKKTDYTPWSCTKVASKATPSQGESFGCPFNYYSDQHLMETLRMKGLNQDQISDIIKLKKEKYSLGCRKLFQYTHEDVGNVSQGIGKHPNSYFFQSYNFELKLKKGLSNL